MRRERAPQTALYIQVSAEAAGVRGQFHDQALDDLFWIDIGTRLRRVMNRRVSYCNSGLGTHAEYDKIDAETV